MNLRYIFLFLSHRENIYELRAILLRLSWAFLSFIVEQLEQISEDEFRFMWAGVISITDIAVLFIHLSSGRHKDFSFEKEEKINSTTYPLDAHPPPPPSSSSPIDMIAPIRIKTGLLSQQGIDDQSQGKFWCLIFIPPSTSPMGNESDIDDKSIQINAKKWRWS